MQSSAPHKKGLTKRQREILDWISEFIAQFGYSPSIEEIGNQHNIKASAASQICKRLQERGYITRGENQTRSISVI